ncbi:DUF4232 domain-containing protein [Streptomyces sp. NPDC020917]|uniref:DUF4232 domain-containing protein n=1 Tax=Streptomyces sp. NPDC020917 TaxID=3365102 RepID=UPI0037A725C7
MRTDFRKTAGTTGANAATAADPNGGTATATRGAAARGAVLAAAAAALALSLSACGGHDGSAESSSSGAPTAGSASTAPSSTAADKAADANGTDGGTTAAPAASTKAGSAPASGTGAHKTATGGGSTPACTFQDVRVTMEKADETPTEHIVLTARNTSRHSCRLLQYPLIAFGDLHTAPDVPAVAKSRPAAPVVLKPGDPAYANVRIALGGVHENARVVRSFSVNLFAPEGPAEGSDDVTAPAGGIAVDDAVAKTGYWTYELRNGADEF